MAKQVVIWMCPDTRCSNYYGSSSQESLDLTKEQRLSRVEDRDPVDPARRILKGHRADCPDCERAGRGRVSRVPIRLAVDVDKPAAA